MHTCISMYSFAGVSAKLVGDDVAYGRAAALDEHILTAAGWYATRAEVHNICI